MISNNYQQSPSFGMAFKWTPEVKKEVLELPEAEYKTVCQWAKSIHLKTNEHCTNFTTDAFRRKDGTFTGIINDATGAVSTERYVGSTDTAEIIENSSKDVRDARIAQRERETGAFEVVG